MFKSKNAKYWIVGMILLPLIIIFFKGKGIDDRISSLALMIVLSPFLLGVILEWFYDVIKIVIVFMWFCFLIAFGMGGPFLGWWGILGFAIYFFILTCLFSLYIKNIKPNVK